MAADNNASNYRRGVMSLVILSLLKREDMYGYQLVQETARSSGGKLTTQTILLDQFVFQFYKAFYQNTVFGFVPIQITLFLKHGMHLLGFHGTGNRGGVQRCKG